VYEDSHHDTTTTDTHHGDDQLTVDVDGQSYEVQENYDFDGDGHNDTAVVETQDGYTAFADTNHDGTADVAVQYDHNGNIVAGAEYNESTGQWTEQNPDSLPTPTGGGADDSGSHHSTGSTGGHSSGGSTGGHSTDTTHQSTDTSSTPGHSGGSTGGHSSGSGEDITVDTKDGQFDAGKAEYDMDGDGTNDTAIVTDDQGNTYAFTDTDHDGTADEAVVIDSKGDVTVAENKGGADWEVAEQGHIDSSGQYHSDSHSGSSGSDSVWAQS
jgi:hypothetical protein